MRYTKDSPRYPFTYAYDWLRGAGLFEARADGPAWVRIAAKSLGVDVEVLQTKAADEYIAYWNEIERLDEERLEKLRWWSNLNQYASDE